MNNNLVRPDRLVLVVAALRVAQDGVRRRTRDREAV